MVFEKNSKSQLRKGLVSMMPNIWRFSLSLTGKPDLADDLTQATCLRALEKAHQYKSSGNLSGWVLTICKSIWLNELRSKAIRKTGSLETAKPEELMDHSIGVEMNIFTSQVYTEIMKLPEAQRVTVDLVYVEGMTYSEAATILDVPIGTIMSRLATARKQLAGLNDDAIKGSTKGGK